MSNLRSFLARVREQMPDQYVEIEKEVDPLYEITAIHQKLDKRGRSPVMFFKRVKGSSMPVVVNVFGTRERLALGLGTTQDKITVGYREREDHPLPPVEVDVAPAQEVVLAGDEANLFDLPAIKAWEPDIGPYINAGILVIKDIDTSVCNTSFGRLQMVDRNTLYTHMTLGRHLHQYYTKAEERGLPLPVTINIGCPPSWALGTLSLIPIDQDELGVMGGMDGEPLKVVKGKSVPVPALAEAEVVVEGEFLPKERQPEGPYCEFSGYSTGQFLRNVIKVKAITMRRDPIYQAIVAGSSEHRGIGAVAKESYLFKVAKIAAPSVKAVHIPTSGCARFHTYVSMEKKANGQPRNVAMGIMSADVYSKLVVVVDQDIDIFDDREVLWAIATRMQADRDISIIQGALGSELDPSSPPDGVAPKVIIDATAKPFLSQFHPRATLPKEVMERIRLEDYIAG
ncbi:MAG: UbiD family decarboxylase [Chloroflexi bacterium]|nr:UbiD family decarboxylase [Chloroflexota bacterium]